MNSNKQTNFTFKDGEELKKILLSPRGIGSITANAVEFFMSIEEVKSKLINETLNTDGSNINKVVGKNAPLTIGSLHAMLCLIFCPEPSRQEKKYKNYSIDTLINFFSLIQPTPEEHLKKDHVKTNNFLNIILPNSRFKDDFLKIEIDDEWNLKNITKKDGSNLIENGKLKADFNSKNDDSNKSEENQIDEKNEDELYKIQPIKNKRKWNLLFRIIIIFILLGGVILYNMTGIFNQPSHNENLTILILPFKRLSKDINENQVEDAIEMDLLNQDKFSKYKILNLKDEIKPAKSTEEVESILKDYNGDIAFHGVIDGKSESMNVNLVISKNLYSTLDNDLFSLFTPPKQNESFINIEMPNIKNLSYIKDQRFIFSLLQLFNSIKNEDVNLFFNSVDSTIEQYPKNVKYYEADIHRIRLIASLNALNSGLLDQAYNYAEFAHKNSSNLTIDPLLLMAQSSLLKSDFDESLEICNFIIQNKDVIETNNNTQLQIIYLIKIVNLLTFIGSSKDLDYTLNDLEAYEKCNKLIPFSKLIQYSISGYYDMAIEFNEVNNLQNKQVDELIEAYLKLLNGDLKDFVKFLKTNDFNNFFDDLNTVLVENGKGGDIYLEYLNNKNDISSMVIPSIFHLSNTEIKKNLIKKLEKSIEYNPDLASYYNFNNLNKKNYLDIVKEINCPKEELKNLMIFPYNPSTPPTINDFTFEELGIEPYSKSRDFILYCELSNLYNELGHSITSEFYLRKALSESLESVWYINNSYMNFNKNAYLKHRNIYYQQRDIDKDFHISNEIPFYHLSDIDSLFYQFYLDDPSFGFILFYKYRDVIDQNYGKELPIWFVQNFADLSYDVWEPEYALKSYLSLLHKEPNNVVWNAKIADIYYEIGKDSLALDYLNTSFTNLKNNNSSADSIIVMDIIDRVYAEILQKNK